MVGYPEVEEFHVGAASRGVEILAEIPSEGRMFNFVKYSTSKDPSRKNPWNS